jgi:capsular exopolysaccharide synthesis family protein
LHELYQYKWLMLGITAVACAASFFWTQRLPRAYQSDCTIEYDPNPIRPLGKDIDDTAAGSYFYWTSREFFATQNKILTSRALAERVVTKLGLHHDADFAGISKENRKSWKGGDIVQLAQALRSRVSVEQERETRIVHIRVTDGNPDRAMLLANAIADAYIDKTMQDRLGSTSGALEWLGQQLSSLKEQLERSELSLHEFVEDKANLSMPFDDQQKLVSDDIQHFNERWNEARMKRLELAARLESLQAANQDDSLAFNHPAIADDETVQDLRKTYYETMREREALSIKYGDRHPQIQALDVQLEEVRKQLRREIDGFISNARAQLVEAEVIESGVQKALAQANKAGLELNLQEITYRRLQRERDNAARLYGSILERTAETDLSHALQVSFVRVVDRALKPSFSIYPSYRRNLTIGALIGALLGIAVAFLLMKLDRVVRTVEEAEALGITVLGILPRIDDGAPIRGPGYSRKRGRNAPEIVTNRDLVVHTHPRSSTAECCRTIRTNLTFMSAERPQRAIVVTSANPREGKTTVTISLAISLAQSGNRVLLVDTDLRKPRIHKAFGLSNAKGATSVLVGEHSVKDAVQQTEIPGLEFLACGPIPPNPSELLHTAQFRELVTELARRYDHVLFDSPPLAAVTDAAIIAPQVDGVLLVVHGQKTTRDAMRSALRQLSDVGAHITGGVLNDVDLSARHYGYGSYYYYHSEGYYEASEQERRSDAPAAES